MMPSIMASFASLHSWEPGSAINGSAKLSSGHNNAGFPGHTSAVAHLEGTKKLESSFLHRRKNCRRVVRHTACSMVVRVPSKACASPNFPLCLVSSYLQQQQKVTLKETKSTARALDDKHVESQTETSPREKSMIDGPLKAAFFDVDGTITRTNVVLAYFAVRMSELPLFVKLFWVPWFALKGIFYLLIDRIDRALFNRVFYRSYNGRSTSLKDAMAALIYKKYYKPRQDLESRFLITDNLKVFHIMCTALHSCQICDKKVMSCSERMRMSFMSTHLCHNSKIQTVSTEHATESKLSCVWSYFKR
jgi:hypothetical protein